MSHNRRRLLLMVSLGAWLCCGMARAQNEHLGTYQPRLSALLDRAFQTIPPGQAGDEARNPLAAAQCLNGDFGPAKIQIASLHSPRIRARAWGRLGYAQRKYKNDTEGAAVSFELARKDAARIEGTVSDREGLLGEIVRFQARSQDFEGAMQTAEALSAWSKFEALADVARAAAREGEFAPAQKLVRLANDDEQKSRTNGLLCIAHAVAFNWEAALSALQKTTLPQHRIPALLVLFDNQKLKEGERDAFLDEALALVPQIQSDDAIDLSEVRRDADYGAIALAQFDNHNLPDVHAAAARSLEILQLVKKSDNAQDSVLKIAAILADEDLSKAHDLLRWSGDDVTTIGAVVQILGKEWDWKNRLGQDTEKAALSEQMSKLINTAMDQVRALDGNDQDWALVEVATMTAQAHDFDTARTLADQIKTPRRKAYAFAGLTQAAIEQNNAKRVQWGLELMEKAALDETDVKERGQIIAQCVQSLLEHLLEDEPVSFSAAAAGLN